MLRLLTIYNIQMLLSSLKIITGITGTRQLISNGDLNGLYPWNSRLAYSLVVIAMHSSSNNNAK